MRAKTFTVLAGGAVLVVAILVWRVAAGHRRAAAAALAEAGRVHASLDAEIRRVNARRAVAEASAVEAQRALAELTAPKAASPPVKTPAARAPASQRQLISTDPKLEALELKWQRAAVTLEYGPFFHTLGLSAEQIRKFAEDSLRHTERWMDLSAVAEAQDAAGREAAEKLKQQAKADHAAAKAELLGAEGYRRLQEYERTLPLRNVVVAGLAGAAAMEGVPLTAQQAERLVEAAVAATGDAATLGGTELAARIDWDALDARARQLLTPAQLMLFKTAAPPSGFPARWQFQIEAAIERAAKADPASVQRAAPERGE
jgi:hypothetical protein